MNPNNNYPLPQRVSPSRMPSHPPNGPPYAPMRAANPMSMMRYNGPAPVPQGGTGAHQPQHPHPLPVRMPLSNQMIQDSSYSHPDRRIMQQQQQMGQQQQQQQQLIQQQQLAQAQAQAQQQQLAQAQAQAQAQQQQLAQAQAQAQAQQQQQLAQQQLAQQQQQIALQQQQQQTALNTAGSHGQHVTNQQVPPSAAAMKRPSQSAPMQQHLPYIQSSSMSGMQQQQPKSPGSSDAGAGTPKVKDALGYLERVKQVFKERQNVYMEFLDIMKQFKASSINTEGVIKRVKSLFEGHNDLILGFNQFLPAGYEIEIHDAAPPPPVPMRQPTQTLYMPPNMMHGNVGNQHHFPHHVPPHHHPMHPGMHMIHQPPIQHTPSHVTQVHYPSTVSTPAVSSSSATTTAAPAPAAVEEPTQNQANTVRPTVEFNQAVSYVAKIKKRFEHAPEIYERFLRILHAYQENKQDDESIENVKKHISKLFANHNDLLQEFGYFLPEGSGSTDIVVSSKRGPKPSRGFSSKEIRRAPFPNASKKHLQPYASEESLELVILDGTKDHSVSFPLDMKREVSVIESIKNTLPRNLYMQFLRCLNLLNEDVISRLDLALLVEDIFLAAPPSVASKLSELLVKFKEVCLEFPDWEERYSESVEKTEYYGFISAMGILNCRQVTPSYRALPDEVVKLPCSGRNQIGDENLNDSMFSLPTGNEGGEEDREKHFVKNQYEEALFRVEDERFELDRIIEANADVLLTLKRVQDDLNLLPFEDLSRYPIESKFNQVQLKAVARLYGDQWYEVMVQLKENPGRTVPIIISRAEQKGKEWDHVKSQLKNSWRSIFQENFYKALDYRSLSFKSEEKKKLNPKHLISELKNAIQKKQSQSSFSAGDSDSHSTVKPAPPCFVYSFSDEEVHQQVYSLILLSANRTYNYPAVSKMLKFCKTFLRHFLNLESTTFVVPSDVDMALDNSDDDKSAIGEDDSDAKNAEDANRMELNDEELPITSGEVKPVRVMLETWSFQEKFNPVRRHTRSSTLFFGNYNFYVFFRLYQMLYSRIFECKKLCQEKDTGDYSLLIKEIHQFVCEKIDSLTFEEDLRTLYGAGSYLLFTIDKLMAQLIKHLYGLVQNSTNEKLVSLYFYEQSRAQSDSESMTLERSAARTRMYLSNCAAIVAEDNSCVQFDYFHDTNELQIDIFEGIFAPEPKSISQDWNSYLESYLTSGDSNFSGESAVKHAPFLNRAVRKISHSCSLSAALDDVIVRNGLESKISLDSYKVHYVEETEDMFIRLKKRPRRNYQSIYQSSASTFRKRMRSEGQSSF